MTDIDNSDLPDVPAAGDLGDRGAFAHRRDEVGEGPDLRLGQLRIVPDDRLAGRR